MNNDIDDRHTLVGPYLARARELNGHAQAHKILRRAGFTLVSRAKRHGSAR
jgi:hypothetical protein